MENLVRVCESSSPVTDVIFIHGLDGDSTSTWHPDKNPDLFWPKFLGEDLPNCNIWTVNYDAASTHWGGESMHITHRAQNILAYLDASEIGTRPLVFICHSLGGLIVKQLLRHANDMNCSDASEILSQTRGIVFLSTPHSGSNIASLIKYIKLIVRPTNTVKELQDDNPYLLELNRWFRNNIEHFSMKVLTFFETKKTKNILVVNETSADPGIPNTKCIPLDDDHQSICKPKSKQALQHRQVLNFIQGIQNENPP